MTYGVFSSAGNLIAWCDSQDAALEALRDLVDEEPEAADDVAAIPVTETGRPCGEAILASAAVGSATAA
jgi:hypothetical protein